MNMDKTACRAKLLQNRHGKVAHRYKILQNRRVSLEQFSAWALSSRDRIMYMVFFVVVVFILFTDVTM